MSKHTSRVKCKHPGCNEWGFYEYDSRKEQHEADAKRREWKCPRHANMDRNLSMDTLSKEVTLVAKRGSFPGAGLFWDGSCGVNYSSAHRAEADDFPEGTKLIVTAKIVIPQFPHETLPDLKDEKR